MAMKRMTLESIYNRSKAEYAERGYDENSWQWKDEGVVYAIQEYLSHCGEMDNADWEFARRAGIESECNWVIETEER